MCPYYRLSHAPRREPFRGLGTHSGPGPAGPRHGSTGPAKSAPCPCSSGKKYKRCGDRTW
ncbi:MAG: hypothetical protein FJ149_06290 [Euryarchaeota archaeon]|nr:hypothetical protein [Euryarchaeota archaeon]